MWGKVSFLYLTGSSEVFKHDVKKVYRTKGNLLVRIALFQKNSILDIIFASENIPHYKNKPR
jgi:hypothetical protein